MSVRRTTRRMTGEPRQTVEVRIGLAPDGGPRVALDGLLYRDRPLVISSVDVLEELIDDLRDVVDHLAPRTMTPQRERAVSIVADRITLKPCGHARDGGVCLCAARA